MRFILLALVGPVLVGAVPFWQPVVDGYLQVKRAFSRVSFGRGDGDRHVMVRDGIEASDQDIFDPNKGCCAGYKRGDYLANITFVTDYGDGIQPDKGYIAIQNQQKLIYLLGDRNEFDNSNMGMYIRKCSKNKKVYFSVWDDEECKTIELPKECIKGAAMCVGNKYSAWPTFHSTSKLDDYTRLANFRFNYKDNTLAQMYVHARSCMPFFLISAVGKSSDSNALKEAYSSSGAAVLADALGFPPSMGLGRHGHGIQKQQKSAFINALAAQFSGLGHEGFDASVDDASLIGAEPTDFNWIGILFQNATYRRHQITDDYFGTPSWCEDGMRAIGVPPEEEC